MLELFSSFLVCKFLHDSTYILNIVGLQIMLDVPANLQTPQTSTTPPTVDFYRKENVLK